MGHAKLFGTDGVRGVANDDLSPELAFKLGKSGAMSLITAGRRGRIVVGKDPRLSADLLESALVSGIMAAGSDVLKVGILSSPAIAYLTHFLGADAGIVISASHNPAEYNGIKFFDSMGRKLAEDVEGKIEELVREDPASKKFSGRRVGIVYEMQEAREQYFNHAINTISGDLSGLKVVVDCANGAASDITPRVLRELGARVLPFADHPDGLNINLNCGSTYPDYLKEIVASHPVDLGLAHDGDSDRVVAVDEKGQVVDGDFIMAICALHLKQQNRLKKNALVTTVMTNLGFDLAMREHGIKVIKTKVGDRYVIEEMLAEGVSLGGEQSGHIIFLDHHSTGDGLITGLQLMVAMRDSEQPLSELSTVMKRLPQVLLNVKVSGKDELDKEEAIWKAVRETEEALGKRGRILVRPSGTEPLVRVMVESETVEEAETLAKRVRDVIEASLT